MDENTPVYSIAVPTNLLRDRNVSATAKLLYGVIDSFQKQTGVCCASNERLAEEIAGCSERTISRCVAELKDNGYIDFRMEKGGAGKAKHRKIYLTPSSVDGQEVDKIGDGSRQNWRAPIDKTGDLDKIGDIVNILDNKTNKKKKNIKKKKIDPLPVFVSWIQQLLGDSVPADVKNGLYLNLVAYKEMRDDSKSPLDTERKVFGLLEDLLEKSNGNVGIMNDMLKTAKRRCWLSVYAPGDSSAESSQKKGRVYEEL